MRRIVQDLSCSVIIPVYGDARHLPELIQRIDRAFQRSEGTAPQIIAVDDCGPGDGWSLISEIAGSRPEMIGIRLMRNFGQHNALMCGFQHATGDVVVTIDDDLQHEPESVVRLIDELQTSGADLVYGVYDEKKHAGGRNIGSWVVNRFYRLVFRMPITVTSFRAVRKELASAILRYDLNFTYIDGLLAWNTQRIRMVTVPHHPRADGKSGYTLAKLIALAMNVFTNFSLLPLQLVSFLGTAAALLGISLGTWYLIAALFAKIQVPGYASIIVAVLVLGGLQLLSLGIIGEYLGRLHLNVNRKPQYTVRSVVSSKLPID
jgi:glycosyltransferase involved in cell wall biosynthesis